MKHIKYIFPCLSCCLLFLACWSDNSPIVINKKSSLEKKIIPAQEIPKAISFNDISFDRQDIQERLAAKIKNKEALIVHLFSPLCDNDNQGIVRVSNSLGDGQNLKSNLYWGALYGIKTHFKKQKDWQLIYSQKDIDHAVLERLVFYKKFENGAKVYFVADAYGGDKMENCLEDYFDALAGVRKDSINLASEKINCYSGADLIIFNGHNGLMDYPDFERTANIDNRAKDAVAIACISQSFFKPYLLASKGYPLVMTTNLMAPEAYVIEAIINNWAKELEGEAIRLKAGDAYHQYQNCGIRGARNLFHSGW